MGSKPPVQNGIYLLVPAFRERVEAVVDLLGYQGYAPLVFETLRSEERAQWLLDEGRQTSGLSSLHLLGMAADIICGMAHPDGELHRWSCPKSCDFFNAYGRAVKAHGLTWGGDFSKPDKPHCQAVPVARQDDTRGAPYPSTYCTAILYGRA